MSKELCALLKKHPSEAAEFRAFMIRLVAHMTPKQRRRALAALDAR